MLEEKDETSGDVALREMRLPFKIVETILLLMVSALPALFLNLPVGIIARYWALHRREKALAASKVKIKGMDVMLRCVYIARNNKLSFWLDRLVVQLSDGLVIYSSEVKGINETNNTPEQSVLKLEHNSKEAFTDGEVTSDSYVEVTSDSSGSSEDESITPITMSKSNNRPHFLCRRRTVSGPQASRVDANGAMAMN